MQFNGHLGPMITSLGVGVVLIGCSTTSTQETAEQVLPAARDSVAVVVFNETAQTLRISGRYGAGTPFVIGEVASDSREGFIFPGHRDAFQLGVRRVGSSSREPRWLGSLDVVPGDSIEYTLSVGGADRAQVTIRKAGRRRTRP